MFNIIIIMLLMFYIGYEMFKLNCMEFYDESMVMEKVIYGTSDSSMKKKLNDELHELPLRSFIHYSDKFYVVFIIALFFTQVWWLGIFFMVMPFIVSKVHPKARIGFRYIDSILSIVMMVMALGSMLIQINS